MPVLHLPIGKSCAVVAIYRCTALFERAHTYASQSDQSLRMLEAKASERPCSGVDWS